MKKGFFYILFIIILFNIICCGNEPPIIISSLYKILIYQKDSLNIPNDSIFLSIFFIIEDDNGIDDIVNVRIIHTDTEFSWNIPVDLLKKSTVIWEEKQYVGNSFLEYNNAASILTGEYLIEVTDSVGNITESALFVEIEGIISSQAYEVPEINYKINLTNRKKEIKITGDKYSSCEIKFLNKTKLFDGGRKKFETDKKIILNNNKPVAANTTVSVRINKDEEENIIYFLKNTILK